MANNKRDEFTQATKNALALRANHQCSFTGCNCSTSGPSDESEEAVISIGVAAHICAASPGGKRYSASMSSEERKHISNGIWLCSNHSTEIDRDESRYTVESLKEMKKKREEDAQKALSNNEKQTVSLELFELGSEIIGIGEIISTSSSLWQIKINHFINGDIPAINSFIGSFDTIDKFERYVISNELGDGRLLSLPPKLEKFNGKYIIKCFTESCNIRKPANELGSSLALNDSHDIFTDENGNLAIVSGENAIYQKIKTVLSVKKDENPYISYGSCFYHFYEYYKDNTLWLNSLLKLDVIRLASIPYLDKFSKENNSTPLICVKRVNSIQLIESERNGNWIPVEFDLEIEGIRNWKKRIPIFI